MMAMKVICPHCAVRYDEEKERRDRFAAAALAGLLANHDLTSRGWNSQQRATVARIQADDLLAELDKPQT